MTPNPALVHAAAAFARTRFLSRALRSPTDVLNLQRARLRQYLRHVAPGVAFYRDMSARRLEELPVMDKAKAMANFARLNRLGVTLEDARAALDAGRATVSGLTVGQSTGTSGNRGVFLISEAERFTWLGVLLAKALPDVLTVRHRVALALPGTSRLYASAGETGRLSLRAFDLADGVDAWLGDLLRFTPDVLVAPPQVLRLLAGEPGLRPRHVFSGAEVLDPLDRLAIEAGFGVRVREIYMATEGLFGVACPHGTLHLAQDVVAFEWEPAADGTDLVSPSVTDFTRKTQVMARYRMNDLLKLSAIACPCGSPLQAVECVAGRCDDLLHLARAGGGLVPITPDVARNAVVDADRRIQDFRVVQTGPDRVMLALAPNLAAAAAQAARSALTQALRRAGASSPEVVLCAIAETPLDVKLRRVRRDLSLSG